MGMHHTYRATRATEARTTRNEATEFAADSLRKLMAAHHQPTAEHMRRVGELAYLIGQRLDYAPPTLDHLRWGGELHDIGKLMISPTALAEPGACSAREQARLLRHPLMGCWIAETLPIAPEVLLIIRQHQERLDGSGGPTGLRDAAITPAARIVAVADTYDSLISAQELYPADALALLGQQAGQLWDGRVVEALGACVAVPPLERAVGR
jgi:putative two-component system response regulator